MLKPQFRKQVELLLDTLPFVAKETCFSLKGGTAINLFVRDFPRLSVDIDLTYLGLESRDEALELTAAALRRIQANIETRMRFVKVQASSKKNHKNEMKLFLTKDNAQIKIEANPVIRGALFSPEERALVPQVVNEFGVEVSLQIASLPDLYGGKIAAALDRQHPRDLFDIKLLFENEGLTRAIQEGFLTYLLFHQRPPHELLSPTRLDMRNLFASEFEGMTKRPFTYDQFEETRERLISEVRSSMTTDDKNFLMGFFDGRPDWTLFPHEKAKDLPALRWKLLNIEKMTIQKRREQQDALRDLLF